MVNIEYRFLVGNASRFFTRFPAVSANSIRDYRFFRYTSCRVSIPVVYCDIIIFPARCIPLVFAVTRANGSHLPWRRRRTDSVVARFWRTRIFSVTRKRYPSGIIFSSALLLSLIFTREKSFIVKV